MMIQSAAGAAPHRRTGAHLQVVGIHPPRVQHVEVHKPGDEQAEVRPGVERRTLLGGVTLDEAHGDC